MPGFRPMARRLLQANYREFKPESPALDDAIARALGGRLAAEDSPARRAVVFAGDAGLARHLGLSRTQILHLDHPEFTLEKLALSDAAYDFVVVDRSLHLCERLDDAGCEIHRVLRPGGSFIVTTSALDQTMGLPWDRRRLGRRGLLTLFAGADILQSGSVCPFLPGLHMGAWVHGRKPEHTPAPLPTVATRRLGRRFYPERRPPRPAKLGVVGIARNEAPYLLEWIAHYRVLGFDPITIYDNESNDATWRLLGPLAAAGEIDAVYWPNRRKQHKQQSAYNDALAYVRTSMEWCLIVDIDEFLVLQPGAVIDDLIPADPTVSAVGIPWRVFGSAGQHRRARGLTIERFLRGACTDSAEFKTLVRPRDVSWMNTHWPTLARGRLADVAGEDIRTEHLERKLPANVARLHHYFCRSREEFECKRARGRGTGPKGSMRPPEIFDSMDMNGTEIRDALPMVPAVAAEVARLKRIVRP